MATPALLVEPIFPATLETKAAKTLKALAKITVIGSDADRALVGALIKDGKDLSKEIETIRFSFTKPLDDKKTAIMNLQKALAGPVDKEVARLANLENAYIREQHRLAEAEKLRLQQEEEAKLKRLSSPKSIAKVQAATEEAINAVAGPTSGVRMDTKFEITDFNHIPREFLCLDEAKVKAAIKAGVENIGGLRIYKEPARSGR